MKPTTIARWLEQNANAPPPPSTPAGLPDDTVSTVYPESSVSNPYASRYTGTRHHRPNPTSRAMHPPPAYLERRPSSAQAQYRDHHSTPAPAPPLSSRNRHNSFDSRYMPTQPQPFSYAYTQPQANQAYYAPASAHYPRNTSHSRESREGRGGYNAQPQPYRVVSSPTPHRVETVKPTSTRQYSYNAYHSTPTITLQTRSTTPKKAPLLRRIFGGIEWGSAPAKTSNYPIREASRSSSKSKSKSHSRSSDRESSYRLPRGRTHSDGIVYVRY